ncbi:hypothetical protein F4778DRAFT_309828 [Xylariomycetidae sp. FL2044]|nr:hypothetical protein F4778DRAFT_309828 [Xylariomycetidae sp. FL2044]
MLYSTRAFHGVRHCFPNPDLNVSGLGYGCPIVKAFFFVNWDMDMVYFEGGLQTISRECLLSKADMNKIQHIAFETSYPSLRPIGNIAHKPRRVFILDRTLHPELLRLIRESLTSVRKVKLVLPYKGVRQALYGVVPCGESVSENTYIQDGQEDGMKTSHPEKFWPCEYEKLVRKWPKDDYGFHHPKPNDGAQDYGLLGRNIHLGDTVMTYQQWIDRMVQFTRQDARDNFLGRSVDVEMVMDHLGFHHTLMQKYYRYGEDEAFVLAYE